MPEAPKSRFVVYSAIVANAGIAMTKFAAAAFSGSSAMLSEGIHSLVDTGNELLLLLGMGRSARPADQQFPFGYAREIYFWTFIVAVLLFSGGGAMAVYAGVMHLRHPAPIRSVTLSLVVIGIAAVFDGTSFVIAMLAMRRRPGAGPLWVKIHHSKDPTVFAVLIEDFAALLGLSIAFASTLLSYRLNNPYIDGVGSIAIGAVICGAAMALAYESKGLLLGESASPRVVADVCAIVSRDPRIQRVHTPLTMQLGPQEILLNLDVEFRDGISAEDHVAAVNSIEDEIRSRYPAIRRIFIEARRRKTAPA
jgi:cation diffusion facilitator family transporter